MSDLRIYLENTTHVLLDFSMVDLSLVGDVYYCNSLTHTLKLQQRKIRSFIFFTLVNLVHQRLVAFVIASEKERVRKRMRCSDVGECA